MYVGHEHVCVSEVLIVGHKVSKKVTQSIFKGILTKKGLNLVI